MCIYVCIYLYNVYIYIYICIYIYHDIYIHRGIFSFRILVSNSCLYAKHVLKKVKQSHRLLLAKSQARQMMSEIAVRELKVTKRNVRANRSRRRIVRLCVCVCVCVCDVMKLKSSSPLSPVHVTIFLNRARVKLT
jgi:hypothetical protein